MTAKVIQIYGMIPKAETVLTSMNTDIKRQIKLLSRVVIRGISNIFFHCVLLNRAWL